MTKVERFRSYLGRLASLAPRLRGYEHVHRVDVGHRYRDGVRTNGLAIRLFIYGPKRPRRHGKAHRLAPAYIDKIPLDVIVFEPERHARAQASGEALYVLRGGMAVSCSNDGVTLGAVVRSSTYPGGQALTSPEVGRRGQVVYQPYAGAPDARPIGTVSASSFHTLSALISIDGVAASVNEVADLATLTGIVDRTTLDVLCAEVAPVHKHGATTGVTHGTLDGKEDISGTVTIVSAGSTLADRGDCGSIWMTSDGRAVALHYAGQAGRALAQAMHVVRDSLGLLVP